MDPKLPCLKGLPDLGQEVHTKILVRLVLEETRGGVGRAPGPMDEAPAGEVDGGGHLWKEWCHEEVTSARGLIMTLREGFPRQFSRKLGATCGLGDW